MRRLCSPGPALQEGPQVQKATVGPFQNRRHAGKPTDAAQPAPPWHHQPQRHKGGSPTQHAAVGESNVEPGHVPGLLCLAQIGGVLTYVLP